VDSGDLKRFRPRLGEALLFHGSESMCRPAHNLIATVAFAPTEIVLTESERGRGILGVVDGFSPKGVEDEGEIKWRDFLRQIGYKL
jgi:adenosine/AMP kinase